MTATITNRKKSFSGVYGVARYGISKYGDGIAGSGIITNRPKS